MLHIYIEQNLGFFFKERKLCAHPYLEVYDGENMYFIAPLARQNEFYVPEVQEAEDRAEDGDDEDDSSVDESVSGKKYNYIRIALTVIDCVLGQRFCLTLGWTCCLKARIEGQTKQLLSKDSVYNCFVKHIHSF